MPTIAIVAASEGSLALATAIQKSIDGSLVYAKADAEGCIKVPSVAECVNELFGSCESLFSLAQWEFVSAVLLRTFAISTPTLPLLM